MYFCVAAPAANRPSFLACATSLRSSASAPSSSSRHRRTGEHFVHQFLDRRHQRQLPGHRALQQESGDDQPVDLVGAFEDAIDAGVAIRALRRILLDKSVARVNLHGLVDDVVDHLRAPDFNDRALDGVLLDRLQRLLRGIGGRFVDLAERRRPSCRPCDRPAIRRHRAESPCWRSSRAPVRSRR